MISSAISDLRESREGAMQMRRGDAAFPLATLGAFLNPSSHQPNQREDTSLSGPYWKFNPSQVKRAITSTQAAGMRGDAVEIGPKGKTPLTMTASPRPVPEVAKTPAGTWKGLENR
jgi:hypothetical protein